LRHPIAALLFNSLPTRKREAVYIYP
jgi:hypothetical protein